MSRKSTKTSTNRAIELAPPDVYGCIDIVEVELVESEPKQATDPEHIRQQAIADAEADFQRIYLVAYNQRMQELVQQHRIGVGAPDLNDVINSMEFSTYDS